MINTNIHRLIRDWEYRVNDGVVDPKNNSHIILFREVLIQNGWPQSAIDEYILHLTERTVGDDEMIKYVDKDGASTEMKAKSARTRADAHPAKIAYNKLTGEDDTEKKPTKTAPSGSSSTNDTDAETDDGSESDIDRLKREKEEGEERKAAIVKTLTTPEPGSDADEQSSDKQDDKEPTKVHGTSGEDDFDVKRDVIEYGIANYEKNTGKKPAPGGPGSAFNEIASGEGVHLLMNNDEMTTEDLAQTMYDTYKDSELGKEQKATSGIKKSEIPNNIDNPNLYSKCIVASRSAKVKFNNTVNRAKSLRSKGLFGTIDTVKTYYGSSESIESQVKAVADANTVILPNGTKVDKEDIVEFINAGGSGTNPSDTATFAMDKNNNLLVQFHSDKTTTGDIQDNSTLNQEGENYKDYISEIKTNKAVKQKLKSIVTSYSNKISKIEANYTKQATPMAARLIELPLTVQLGIIKNDKGTIKKNIDAAIIGKTGIKDQYKLLAPSGKSAKQLSIQDKYRMIQSLVAGGNGKALDVKVINKIGLAYQALHPDTGGIDVKSNLSVQRKRVVSLQRKRVNELNKTMVKVGNKLIQVGVLMEAEESIRGFHLDLMDYPTKNYVPGDSSTIAGEALDINMGGVEVNGDILRQCIGVGSTDEFKQKFRLSETDEFSKDSEGNITGKTVFVYAIDSDGNTIDIGKKSYRSKAGATGKTNNTLTYSTAMQNCFKSKS